MLPVVFADMVSLADMVSFVTIHILPYWEDHPVGIDVAIAHIVTIAEEMRKTFDKLRAELGGV